MNLYIRNEEDLINHYRSLPCRASSVTDFIGILEYKLPTRIFYFRGEPKQFETPCLPSIWRGELSQSEIDPPDNADVWTKREQEVLTEFRDRFLAGELVDPYFDHDNPPDRDSPEWIELAQHHGYPTRLLDVTVSIPRQSRGL